jgi:hypothetical protein
MTADHPITDTHEIARLLALNKGEQAQLVQVSSPNPKALEHMRKYLEESVSGMEWVDRAKCIYRRPK